MSSFTMRRKIPEIEIPEICPTPPLLESELRFNFLIFNLGMSFSNKNNMKDSHISSGTTQMKKELEWYDRASEEEERGIMLNKENFPLSRPPPEPNPNNFTRPRIFFNYTKSTGTANNNKSKDKDHDSIVYLEPEGDTDNEYTQYNEYTDSNDLNDLNQLNQLTGYKHNTEDLKDCSDHGFTGPSHELDESNISESFNNKQIEEKDLDNEDIYPYFYNEIEGKGNTYVNMQNIGGYAGNTREMGSSNQPMPVQMKNAHSSNSNHVRNMNKGLVINTGINVKGNGVKVKSMKTTTSPTPSTEQDSSQNSKERIKGNSNSISFFHSYIGKMYAYREES